ncbi:MAG TPA: hypothetical protein VIR79_05945 [Nitrospira sp.]
MAGLLGVFASLSAANHQGHAGSPGEETHKTMGQGYEVAGALFRVFLGTDEAGGRGSGGTPLDRSAQTVRDALAILMQHRTDYPRFDEAVKNDMLQAVIIEPHVVNQEGKAFPFLVARTKEPGRVKLLISASSLSELGYLNHSERLAPVLAREFQWVVSKADTTPKAKVLSAERDLEQAPIRTNREVQAMQGKEREHLLQQLFERYLLTVDDLKSLNAQAYYEVGKTALIPPTHPDSTTKLYDIRVREALQRIVREPYFEEHTPKAIRSLLNGKIWNVAFVKIDQRDWATRTRVLPEEKAVVVGKTREKVQPASILINIYREAAPDDPFYPETKGLPMGALSPDQLARVIAWEIEKNITEKSMRGHVAQDELTAPK